MAQHPRVHERAVVHQPFRKPYQDYKNAPRPSGWQSRNFKGSGTKGKGKSFAFYSEDVEDEGDEDWNYDDQSDETLSHYGYMADGLEENNFAIDPFETGTFSQEYLAYLVDHGLKTEGDSAEQAADLIQAEIEAWIRCSATAL